MSNSIHIIGSGFSALAASCLSFSALALAAASCLSFSFLASSSFRFFSASALSAASFSASAVFFHLKRHFLPPFQEHKNIATCSITGSKQTPFLWFHHRLAISSPLSSCLSCQKKRARTGLSPKSQKLRNPVKEEREKHLLGGSASLLFSFIFPPPPSSGDWEVILHFGAMTPENWKKDQELF